MAHKKGAGSTRNGRDSESKRLGVKLYGGQTAIAGNIIIRQRGTKYHPGLGVGLGKDHTIFATTDGIVTFTRKRDNRLYVSVLPKEEEKPVAKKAAPKKAAPKKEEAAKAEAVEAPVKEAKTEEKPTAKKKATAKKTTAKKTTAKADGEKKATAKKPAAKKTTAKKATTKKKAEDKGEDKAAEE